MTVGCESAVVRIRTPAHPDLAAIRYGGIADFAVMARKDSDVLPGGGPRSGQRGSDESCRVRRGPQERQFLRGGCHHRVAGRRWRRGLGGHRVAVFHARPGLPRGGRADDGLSRPLRAGIDRRCRRLCPRRGGQRLPAADPGARRVRRDQRPDPGLVGASVDRRRRGRYRDQPQRTRRRTAVRQRRRRLLPTGRVRPGRRQRRQRRTDRQWRHRRGRRRRCGRRRRRSRRLADRPTARRRRRAVGRRRHRRSRRRRPGRQQRCQPDTGHRPGPQRQAR